MIDPFKIDGPTCISFSGGRTSAYMLWRVLQSNGGLPEDARVVFCNTGKEDEATLRFVRDCETNWGIPIVWLEYQSSEPGWSVVDFDSASRKGEPFEALIRKRNFLPNPVARFCTVELKILTAERYLRSVGWSEWDNMVGIRADEQRRVSKMRADPSGGRKGVSRLIPLADAHVSVQDVLRFWELSPFNLDLQTANGQTPEGNCDLCFLKPAHRVFSLVAMKPERAIWWAAQEGSISNPSIKNGGLFRSDRPSYAQMAKYASEQLDMFSPDEEGIECFCGD